MPPFMITLLLSSSRLLLSGSHSGLDLRFPSFLFLLTLLAMNKSPLISSAGRDHVLLSKQLAIVLSL
jgi:hypothetical protein